MSCAILFQNIFSLYQKLVSHLFSSLKTIASRAQEHFKDILAFIIVLEVFWRIIHSCQHRRPSLHFFFSYRFCFACHSAIQLNGSANNIYNACTRMKQKNENSMKNLHCDPENYSIFECNYRNIVVCFLKIVPCCYQILTIKLFVHILHKKMVAAGWSHDVITCF